MKKSILGVCTVLTFLSACADSNEAPNEKKVAVQSTSSTSYLLVKVRGKEHQCLQLKVVRSSVPYSTKLKNEITVTPTESSESCGANILAVDIPYSKKSYGKGLYPYLLEIPIDWMSNEIAYGSCSVQIQIDELAINFDICKNGVVTKSLSVKQENEITILENSNVTVEPVAITDEDLRLRDKSIRAFNLFLDGVIKLSQTQMSEKDTEYNLNEIRKIWEEALNKALVAK